MAYLMTLRSKFILFLALIHLILIIMALQWIPENPYIFVAAELLIIISIAISFQLYKAYIRPLNLISAGIESIKDKDFSTKFVEVGQQEMDQLIGVYNGMIEQLREERIKQNEKHYFLEKLIKASPSGIIVLDVEDKIYIANPTAIKLLEREEALVKGKSLSQLPGVLAGELAKLKAGESKVVALNGILLYKCQKSHFIDRGFHHHFVLIEELTEEVLRIEKKAYEKVIRMMSHEINNSVGAINSILHSILLFKSQLSEEDRTDYENVITVAIDRNTHLSRFMTNFANVVRIPPPQPSLYNLHDLLQSVRILMNAHYRQRQIEWHWDLAEEPLTIKMDSQQIEQVLINIIKNAVEAIEQNGCITIQTRHSPPQLSIRDNGKGIPKEIMHHLFSPFYSTKKDGQGIGLTFIREILINHGFPFSLQTNLDGLTEFKILFDTSPQSVNSKSVTVK